MLQTESIQNAAYPCIISRARLEEQKVQKLFPLNMCESTKSDKQFARKLMKVEDRRKNTGKRNHCLVQIRRINASVPEFVHLHTMQRQPLFGGVMKLSLHPE